MSVNVSAAVEQYRLVLQPDSACDVGNLPSAGQICDALEACGSKGTSPIRISDMLPHDCLYKPIALDLTAVQSDEAYRALKRLRSAKYIQTGLLASGETGKTLLQKIMQGTVVVEDGFLSSAFDRVRDPFQKHINPKYENPIVFRITPDCLFDVYFSSDEAVRCAVGERRSLPIGGNVFRTVRIEPEQPMRDGQPYVLQADYPVNGDVQIAPDSGSVFRVRCIGKTQIQTFRAGSVFDPQDAIEAQGDRFYPYIIRWEGNA